MHVGGRATSPPRNLLHAQLRAAHFHGLYNVGLYLFLAENESARTLFTKVGRHILQHHTQYNHHVTDIQVAGIIDLDLYYYR